MVSQPQASIPTDMAIASERQATLQLPREQSPDDDPLNRKSRKSKPISLSSASLAPLFVGALTAPTSMADVPVGAVHSIIHLIDTEKTSAQRPLSVQLGASGAVVLWLRLNGGWRHRPAAAVRLRRWWRRRFGGFRGCGGGGGSGWWALTWRRVLVAVVGLPSGVRALRWLPLDLPWLPWYAEIAGGCGFGHLRVL